VFLTVAEYRNLDHDIFSWLLEGNKRGKNGTCMTHEQIAESVTHCTGRKCSPSSVKAAMKKYQAQGLVFSRFSPTGNKMLTSQGTYVTKRIKCYMLTPEAKLLNRPNEKMTDLSHIALPSQNLPPIEETRKQALPKGLEPVSLVSNDNKNSATLPVCTTSQEGNEDDPTQAPGEERQELFEHRPLTETPKARRKPGPGTKRKNRNLRANTWTNLRHQFLHELKSNLDFEQEPELSGHILRIARTQTDRFYPAGIPGLLDWDHILWSWREQTWHNRRQRLRKSIIPALGAHVALLVPPDTDRMNNPKYSAGQRLQARQDYRRWQTHYQWRKTLCQKILDKDSPEIAKEYVREHEFVINLHSDLLDSGRIEPKDISEETHKIFRGLADIIGED